MAPTGRGGSRGPAVLVTALLILLAGACTGGGDGGRSVPTTQPDGSDAGALPAPPSPEIVVVAQAMASTIEIFEDPAQIGPALRTVSSPRPSGAPAVFLVLQQRAPWVEVLLPVRPTGSRGWIRTDQVRLTQHRWRIVIELAAHRLTVFSGPDVLRVETVGVGTASTPTPGGRYYTTELLQPPNPGGPYGAFAFGLSGYTGETNGQGNPSDPVYGQLGLHGTNDPTSLGRDVSLGCIRMPNEAIAALAAELPLGVPVDVRR